MPTVYEATQLECRQAFSVFERPGGYNSFEFPNCSANKCSHWVFTKTYSILQNKEYGEADKLKEEGWKVSGTYLDLVTLTKEIELEKQEGRCGLVWLGENNC